MRPARPASSEPFNTTRLIPAREAGPLAAAGAGAAAGAVTVLVSVTVVVPALPELTR